MARPSFALVLALVAGFGWPFAAACVSLDPPPETPPPTTSGGGGVDYNGTTGSGDEEINSDIEGEPDTEDPSKPECAPDSDLDENGNCIASCFDVDGYCADDDPTECEGYDPIVANDCGTCCAIPEDEIPECPPEGCLDDEDEEDCPPGEDCSYTETCPDTVCDADEDCDTCPLDCGACEVECGDGFCDEGKESCQNCADDCECPATCGDGECTAGETVADTETCLNCKADCGKCMKVLTWDINAGLKKGKKKVKQTLKSIANLIALEKPDYVGLQSVDKNTKRSGKIDEAHFIAKRTKMYKRFGAAFNYNEGQYGIAFLSKHKISGMTKTQMPTSGEWAKRRILLTASLELETYFTYFHLGVTQLARKDAPRLAQAGTIAKDLGFEANAILVGDMFEIPTGDAVAKLQANDNLLDTWPDYSSGGKGLTTAKKRVDYVMPGFNWYFQVDDYCPKVVKTYVKPAKGLASHRAVVTVFQRGALAKDANCGEASGSAGDDGYDGYADDGSDLGYGDDGCTSDADCAMDEIYKYCVEGYCSECRTTADCTDPEYPTCTGDFECQ